MPAFVSQYDDSKTAEQNTADAGLTWSSDGSTLTISEGYHTQQQVNSQSGNCGQNNFLTTKGASASISGYNLSFVNLTVGERYWYVSGGWFGDAGPPSGMTTITRSQRSIGDSEYTFFLVEATAVNTGAAYLGAGASVIGPYWVCH